MKLEILTEPNYYASNMHRSMKNNIYYLFRLDQDTHLYEIRNTLSARANFA